MSEKIDILEMDIKMTKELYEHFLKRDDLYIDYRFEKAEEFLGYEIKNRIKKIKRDHC